MLAALPLACLARKAALSSVMAKQYSDLVLPLASLVLTTSAAFTCVVAQSPENSTYCTPPNASATTFTTRFADTLWPETFRKRPMALAVVRAGSTGAAAPDPAAPVQLACGP